MRISEDAIRERAQIMFDSTYAQVRDTIRFDTPIDNLSVPLVAAVRAVAKLQLQMEALMEIPAIAAVLKARSHEEPGL